MKRVILISTLFACFALTIALMSPQGGRAQGPGSEESQIQQDFAIAPVHLDLSGKNRALVGLGSYLVACISETAMGTNVINLWH